MDPKAIKVSPKTISNPATLMPCTVNLDVAEGLENDLKGIISQTREDSFGLSSVFDDELAYLLQPAVAAYENERLTGK